jgi:hypothetical protein
MGSGEVATGRERLWKMMWMCGGGGGEAYLPLDLADSPLPWAHVW